MTPRHAPLTARLRRQRLLPGLILVWLFAFQTVIGGLALARALPVQHLALQIGQSLCAPGDGGPVPPDHEHPDCTLCLPNGSLTGPAALPAQTAGLGPATMPPGEAHGVDPASAAPPSVPERSAAPRGPPARA
ncbi:MAG: hypothetical protein ACRCUX_09460 [Beijerinckiaceae bacterium]